MPMRDLIIHDTTPIDAFHRPEYGRGYVPRDSADPTYGGVAEPFPAELVIPRSEWQARIEEMERTKTRISDLCDLEGLKVKDQQQTSYCWINATTHCVEIDRLVQHEQLVSLSPASAGARITNYRNEGGNGGDAMAWVAEHGLVPSKLWPDNAIDRRYATPEALQAAMEYRLQSWWALDPANFDEIVSALLLRYPVNAGLNWWGHQVTYVDPVWLDGEIAVRFDNSWGVQYGTNGRGVLQGRRMVPDDATAPRSVLAT